MKRKQKPVELNHKLLIAIAGGTLAIYGALMYFMIKLKKQTDIFEEIVHQMPNATDQEMMDIFLEFWIDHEQR